VRVLVACEESQVVCKAFREKGHEAYSADIQDCSGGHPEWHIKGDVLKILDDGWDLMIGHPPCTYLTTTGNKWFKPEYRDRFPGRQEQRQQAIDFFMALVAANIPKIAIENPVGIMSTTYRRPNQYVHPYFFGDKHSKKTGLWLKGLPLLTPTEIVEPEMYIYKDGRKDPMWHVESMKLPKDERTRLRSKTFPGIAKAMAEQWGNL
jgi:site-specific DNA-cytosine methylase